MVIDCCNHWLKKQKQNYFIDSNNYVSNIYITRKDIAQSKI